MTAADVLLMLDILQNLACAVAVGQAHAPYANPDVMSSEYSQVR